jgi:hypothetical protein
MRDPLPDVATSSQSCVRLTESSRWAMVGWQSPAPGSHLVGPLRAMDRIPPLSRTSFSAPEAHIVVSTDGYFDVYPSSARTDGDKPAYRGRLAELGAGIRGTDDRLAVRPTSAALSDAVIAWSAVHGTAALGGGLGGGRDGNEPEA